MSVPFAVLRQHYVPQHALTRFGGWLSHSRIPWLKDYLIQWFLNRYPVNLAEAIEPNPKAYASYHDFFIRKLKPELRPIDTSALGICSPCDGAISQIGTITQGTMLQAKGHAFSIASLLGSSEDAALFKDGHFATIYLAPIDYHRVHMPFAGTLQKLRYIPGRLFSVNPLTTEYVDDLFAKNERVVCVFKHKDKSFAVILVGAMIVGSIFTRWGGHIKPHRGKQVMEIKYPQSAEQHITLAKGDEMGYFSLGSTVIILSTDKMDWDPSLAENTRLIVGQKIGEYR